VAGGVRDYSDCDRERYPGADNGRQNPNVAARALIVGHKLIFYLLPLAGKTFS
jgi:hypothetical protein